MAIQYYSLNPLLTPLFSPWPKITLVEGLDEAPADPYPEAMLKPLVPFALMLTLSVFSKDQVFFPTDDGGRIQADIYGKGQNGIILAHGGRFNKDSWTNQIGAFTNAGFRVLSLNFRGYGDSKGPGDKAVMDAPLYKDILGAAQYLKKEGVKKLSIVAGSLGAGAAMDASISAPQEFQSLVLLAGGGGALPPENLQGRKLFIIARDDRGSDDRPRLQTLMRYYEKVPEPKRLQILEGSAHAQFLFETQQGENVLKTIVDFISNEK
jgi:pimeloyl-ACP methyl ester carboxylesterase